MVATRAAALRVIILQILINAECEHALKGLALPHASHFSETALSGPRRLRAALATAPVLFAHAFVTEIKIGRMITTRQHVYDVLTCRRIVGVSTWT